MLSFEIEIFKGKNFIFFIYGTPTKQTKIYNFFNKEFKNKDITKKLANVLSAIDTNPLRYSHEEKFKLLEDNIWEIKIKPIRIACQWVDDKHKLVALYGFNKKTAKWPVNELNNMRRQKEDYNNLKFPNRGSG